MLIHVLNRWQQTKTLVSNECRTKLLSRVQIYIQGQDIICSVVTKYPKFLYLAGLFRMLWVLSLESNQLFTHNNVYFIVIPLVYSVIKLIYFWPFLRALLSSSQLSRCGIMQKISAIVAKLMSPDSCSRSINTSKWTSFKFWLNSFFSVY